MLDLGCGTGANFAHFVPDADVVAVDPDWYMLRRALRHARELHRAIGLVEAPAEALPFADASFDTVVVALALCTVSDLDASLGEVRRVLRRGGELRFFEHVRSEGGWARFQDAVTPLWRAVAAGCQPNRDTVGALRRAGFRTLSIERHDTGVYPVRPLVSGVAIAESEEV